MPLLMLVWLSIFPATTVTMIELRAGDTIEADGPVVRDGSRTIFRSGTKVYSLATEDIASIVEVDRPLAPRSPAARSSVVNVSAVPVTERSLHVDPLTAQRILESIGPSENPGGATVTLPAPVNFPPPSPDAPDPAEEHYWRERSRDAQDRVLHAREELQLLERRAQRLNDEILGLLALGYDESQMGRQAWQLQNTRDQMERAAIEIERAERELSRVQKDARREGIYPSWLRD